MKHHLSAAILAIIITGCAATGHIGNWAHDDAKGYTGLSLESNGRCKLIGVEKGGAGVGTWCRYSRVGDTLEIHEFWDNSGTKHKPDVPVRFRYIGDRDIVVVAHEGITITLHRVPALIE
jgi:hypothetical protein